MSRVESLVSFRPSGSKDRDDLLVVSSSFERRCVGFCEFLASSASDYRAKSAICIRYSDRGDALIRSRAIRLGAELGALVDRIAESKLDEHMEPYAIIEPIEVFRQHLDCLVPGASVVVDLSTITKLHCLYLVDAGLKSHRVAEMRVVYTRARYGRHDTLSWGAEEPVLLPGFGRPRQFDERSHLVMFCGLEPDRSYSVWRRFGQEGCTAVYVDSGDEDIDRCAFRARRLHTFATTATVETLPAFRPLEVADFLRAKYDGLRNEGRYMYIAPMTTKWEVVALPLFFARLPVDAAAGIVYASPGRLNASGHTRDELGQRLAMRIR